MSQTNLTNNNYVGGSKKDKVSDNKKIRPSPTDSATLYKVDTKRTGNDGNIWKVTENINGIKRWKLYKKKTNKGTTKSKKDSTKKKKDSTKSKEIDKGSTKDKKTKKKKYNKKNITALDLYDIVHVNETEFKNICKKSNHRVQDTINHLMGLITDLRNLGIIAHIIPLPPAADGTYWSDYANDYLNDVYGREWYKNPKGYMYFAVYMNSAGTEINDKHTIDVSYSDLKIKEKIQIIKLLDHHFQDRYTWTGRNTDKIFIQYIKTKTPKIDISLLKDDDVYPLLIVNVQYSNKIDLLRTSGHLVPDMSDTFHKILGLDKNETTIHYNYGINDAEFEVNAIPMKLYNKKISNIIRHLDNEIKNNNMDKYEIKLLSDFETVQESFTSKTGKSKKG
jgi:hypothetical protein